MANIVSARCCGAPLMRAAVARCLFAGAYAAARTVQCAAIGGVLQYGGIARR